MKIKKQEAFYRHSVYFRRMLENAVKSYKTRKDAGFGLNLILDNWENIKSAQKWSAKSLAEDEKNAALCLEFALIGKPFLNARLHPNERFEWINSGIAAAEKLNRRKEKGQLCANVGYSYAQLGEVHQAIEYCQKALTISREDRRKKRWQATSVWLKRRNQKSILHGRALKTNRVSTPTSTHSGIFRSGSGRSLKWRVKATS